MRKMTLFSSVNSERARASWSRWMRWVLNCGSRGAGSGSGSWTTGGSVASTSTWSKKVTTLLAVNTGEYTCRKRSRSVARSPAVWYRSSGRLDSAFITMRSSCGGMSRRSEVGGAMLALRTMSSSTCRSSSR